MLALDCVVEEAKFGRAQFDCQQFTETVLLPDLTASDGQCSINYYIQPILIYDKFSVAAAPCFLMGRCLCLAAKMSTLLKPPTISQ